MDQELCQKYKHKDGGELSKETIVILKEQRY